MGFRTGPLSLLRRPTSRPDEFGDALFRNNPNPMWVYDSRTLRFLDVNEAAIAHYGYSRQEFLAMAITDIRPKEDRSSVLRSLSQARALHDAGIFRHRTKDGRLLRVSVHSHEFVRDGSPARLVVLTDVTAQLEAEEHLREAQISLGVAQEIAHLGSFTADLVTGQMHWSDELYRILGVNPQGADLSKGLWPYDHPDDAASVRAAVDAAREERRSYNIDHRIRRPNGEVRHVQERGFWVFDQSGRRIRVVGTVLDITERKMAEEALAHLAYHDSLTGLLNRSGLVDRLVAHTATGDKRLTALFFFDLDRFKSINDTLGHGAGDRVLEQVGRRLSAVLKRNEFLAHTGGDEFAVVSPGLPARREVSRRAGELLEIFAQPFTIGAREHIISASVGASIYPTDANDPASLLRNADVAMYAAKACGGSTFQLYTADLQHEAARRFRLESALRRAIEHEEFTMHYQPVLCVRTGKPVAVEALLRWNDPEAGPMLPGEFIAFAEETGLIGQIGRWAFDQTFAQAKRWSDAGTPVRVWVNVSASQLNNQALPFIISGALKRHHVDPSLIGLELTESSFINAGKEILSTLHQIKALGIRLALDDFGVKYSSLEYLHRLPIDTVKIDRIFIKDMLTNRFNASIVRAIIGVSHDVGFEVTAEGIEQPEELEFIRTLNCDSWQGFYFSAARPPSEIDTLLSEGSLAGGNGERLGGDSLREVHAGQAIAPDPVMHRDTEEP